MRRRVLTALGVAALVSASVANAAITVTSSTGFPDIQGNPCAPCGSAPLNLAVATNGGTSSITFGVNPTGTAFDTTFMFLNDVAGTYNIDLGTSTQNLLFNLITVTPQGGATTTFAPPSITALQQFGLNLLGNTIYTVRIAGTSQSSAGEFHGGITAVNGAVPEPATWAMMLFGFAGIGMAMRRRRVLSQARTA